MKISSYSSRKSKILRWHHPNVIVACLSAEEVHTPPGQLQDKSLPMKIFKNHKKQNIKNHSENHQKF